MLARRTEKLCIHRVRTVYSRVIMYYDIAAVRTTDLTAASYIIRRNRAGAAGATSPATPVKAPLTP